MVYGLNGKIYVLFVSILTPILRHKNGKWYAAILRVEKSKLGFKEEGTVDIINVKCEPDMVGLLTQTYGFLPCLLYTSRCV